MMNKTIITKLDTALEIFYKFSSSYTATTLSYQKSMDSDHVESSQIIGKLEQDGFIKKFDDRSYVITFDGKMFHESGAYSFQYSQETARLNRDVMTRNREIVVAIAVILGSLIGGAYALLMIWKEMNNVCSCC